MPTDRGYGMGVTAADADNDGDQDLYVTNAGGNRLLLNDGGSGRFEDVTAEAGVGDPRWGTACAFLDYDGDGDLDLFVVNYVDFDMWENPVCKKGKHRSYCDPDTYDPVEDVLYRNDGGRFTDVSRAGGITLSGRGLGVALSDYDLDGDTDVYVANDGTMNFLYENQPGGFVEVGLYAGGRYNRDGLAEAGMGVDFGDVQNDGRQDLFVTNFTNETNTLYVNDGQGELHDLTERFGLTGPSLKPLGFGTRFLDYDNDRFLDLFVANGHVMDIIAEVEPELSYPQPNQVFRNLGGGGFAETSAQVGTGLEVVAVSRAAAAGDCDNDGDQDPAGDQRLRAADPAAERRRQPQQLAPPRAGRSRAPRRPGGPGDGHRRRQAHAARTTVGGELPVEPRSAPALRPRAGPSRPRRDRLARRAPPGSRGGSGQPHPAVREGQG